MDSLAAPNSAFLGQIHYSLENRPPAIEPPPGTERGGGAPLDPWTGASALLHGHVSKGQRMFPEPAPRGRTLWPHVLAAAAPAFGQPARRAGASQTHKIMRICDAEILCFSHGPGPGVFNLLPFADP